MTGQTSCKHGKVVSEKANKVVIGSVSGGLYGPDCRVRFMGPNDGYSVVNFQQNYCVLEAGDITVKRILGAKPQYTADPGSFKPAEPGKVSIMAFE